MCQRAHAVLDDIVMVANITTRFLAYQILWLFLFFDRVTLDAFPQCKL